ncbi:MAG TPA: EamA family transporter [Fibrobacteria bacterium]|nr:EamA family transporter [Fibrobacteria bacterium]HOX52767.1 EamA family transporter [Fibrobacteria bacterium]
MDWIFLSLCSAFALGVYDVGKKSAVDKNAMFPTLFLCSGVAALVVLPLLLLTLVSPATADHLGVAVEPLGARGQLLVLAKTAIVTTSWTLSFLALKHLPLSIAAPVRASAPLFTLLGAIVLFGEMPSVPQWIGIAMILGSYFAFSVIGRAEGIHFTRSPWVWALFAATAMGSVSALWDKNLLQGEHLPPLAMQVWFSIDNAILQGLLWATLGRREKTAFKLRWQAFSVGPLLLVADAAYFRALAQPGAMVSIVSSIRRANVVVSFALGALAFREKNLRWKALALVGVLAGLALILRG